MTVLLRVPRDLQLSLVTPVQDLPSCLPRNSTKADNVKTVAAFANEPVHFEASLSVGENLTFVWILDEDQNRARIVPIPADCVDRECTTSRQVSQTTLSSCHPMRLFVCLFVCLFVSLILFINLSKMNLLFRNIPEKLKVVPFYHTVIYQKNFLYGICLFLSLKKGLISHDRWSMFLCMV